MLLLENPCDFFRSSLLLASYSLQQNFIERLEEELDYAQGTDQT
jgi:hypothetical protein